MASIKTKFAVGLFVIIGFSLAFIAIVWFGMSDYFEKGKSYTAFFDESVQGLEKDSSVKYRGVSIGRVESIGVAPDATLIQVVLKIEKGLKLDIQLGKIVAQLKSVGITGIMFIELDQKKPSEPDLSPKLSFEPKYPAIATKPSGITKLLKGIEEVIAQFNSLDIGSISSRLQALLDNLDQSIEDINFKQISANVISSLEKIENILNTETWDKLMRSIESTGQSINEFSQKANNTVSSVNQAVAGAKTAVSRIDRLVANNEKDLTESISNFKHLVENANKFFSQGTHFIQGGDEQLENLNHQLTLVLQNFEIASESLNRLIEIIATQPSQLLFGQPPPSRKIEPN